MSHVERRIREKKEIRQRILDTARDIAAREGLRAVTIRRIAESIEYTPPIVYEHFDGKETIIKELVFSAFNMIQDEIEKVQMLEEDPKRLVLAISLVYWDFAQNNNELFMLMFNIERPMPNDEMASIFQHLLRVFKMLAQGNEELAQELMISWACLTHGALFVLCLIKPPHFESRDKREVFIAIINRFLNSI